MQFSMFSLVASTLLSQPSVSCTIHTAHDLTSRNSSHGRQPQNHMPRVININLERMMNRMPCENSVKLEIGLCSVYTSACQSRCVLRDCVGGGVVRHANLVAQFMHVESALKPSWLDRKIRLWLSVASVEHGYVDAPSHCATRSSCA